ncbi:uncharacterized protein LOC111363479 [Spodoptera litura]|uniref:Uncharacterized protein LOC111363479 n=1 Tax=Spodoptera litura TaxID=69820 RepID=A0A9J7J1Y6_SPOLT|nr:uncharacterized protein LOC111363479 [Spodoptera litura]
MLRAPVTTALVASRSPSPEATGSRVEPPHERTTITPPRASTERPIATASHRRPILMRESLNEQRINTLLKCYKNADEEHAANMAIMRLQEQREKEMLVQEKLKTEQEEIKLEILKLQLKKLQ